MKEGSSSLLLSHIKVSLINFETLLADTATSVQLVSSVSVPLHPLRLLPLLWGLQSPEPGNWPSLPWLSLPLLLSSFSLHPPAVIRLTCKASSQKSVRAVDRLCRLRLRVHSYTAHKYFSLPVSRSLSRTQQIN